MRAVPFLPHGVTGRSYRRPLSPSGSGCHCHGSKASRPRNVCFVSVELCTFVLPLRLFFVKNFAVILVEARESALALFLAWLLGRYRSSVARKLPPVLCSSGTGSGLSRARSLRHSLLIHPSPDVSLGLSFLMVSACLHTYMYSDYFMEICEYIILRLSRSFLKVTFDSFSSSAPSI